MTFAEITTRILEHPNCTIDCDYFLIPDVHFCVKNQIEIVSKSNNPKKECKLNKQVCQMILRELENGNFIELNTKYLKKP